MGSGCSGLCYGETRVLHYTRSCCSQKPLAKQGKPIPRLELVSGHMALKERLKGTQKWSIEEISLHVFRGESGQGVAAVVYAVVKQGSCITQGLVAARNHLLNKESPFLGWNWYLATWQLI